MIFTPPHSLRFDTIANIFCSEDFILDFNDYDPLDKSDRNELVKSLDESSSEKRSTILETVSNSINFFDYVISFGAFNGLHKYFNTKYNSKMSNNFTALTHASGSVLLAGKYLLNKNPFSLHLLRTYGTGYFLYDACYLLKNWKTNTMNLFYLYHHFASLCLLHSNPKISYGPGILFFAEFANLPSYLVYYYKKQHNKTKLVKKLKYLQFFLYSTIRIFVIGKYLKDSYHSSKEHNSYSTFYICSPVFLMTLVWAKKLYNNL